MNESATDLYVKGKYLENNPTWHEEDSPWKARQVLEMLARNHVEPRSVCEVGCGAGEVLKEIHDALPANVQFTGFEIAPLAYELCKPKASPRLRYQLGDLNQEQGVSYDLLLAMDVFEHVEDYYGFLRALKCHAEYKIFHVPLDISVQGLLTGKLMRTRLALGHIQYFTKETALATLEYAGYRVLDHFYTARALDLPAPSFFYRVGKLPLRLTAMLNKDLAVRLFGGHSLLVLAS